MKKFILTVAITLAELQAQECSSLLEQSMKIADGCLAELAVNQNKLKTASLYSNEKIAAVLEMNDNLKIENRELQEANTKLLVKLRESKKKYASVQHLLKLHSEEQMHIKTKSSALGAHVPIAKEKSSHLVCETKNREVIHKRSRELKERYGNLSDKELLNKHIYRVPTYMLNVRYGASRKYNISNVLKRGELVEFTEVSKKPKDYIWVKTVSGWVFVSNKSSSRYIAKYKNSRPLRVALSK